eukprot:623344-Pleurochrysis_carterae.AAC.9
MEASTRGSRRSTGCIARGLQRFEAIVDQPRKDRVRLRRGEKGAAVKSEKRSALTSVSIDRTDLASGDTLPALAPGRHLAPVARRKGVELEHGRVFVGDASDDLEEGGTREPAGCTLRHVCNKLCFSKAADVKQAEQCDKRSMQQGRYKQPVEECVRHRKLATREDESFVPMHGN